MYLAWVTDSLCLSDEIKSGQFRSVQELRNYCKSAVFIFWKKCIFSNRFADLSLSLWSWRSCYTAKDLSSFTWSITAEGARQPFSELWLWGRAGVSWEACTVLHCSPCPGGVLGETLVPQCTRVAPPLSDFINLLNKFFFFERILQLNRNIMFGNHWIKLFIISLQKSATVFLLSFLP